jgi:hypothetical protein
MSRKTAGENPPVAGGQPRTSNNDKMRRVAYLAMKREEILFYRLSPTARCVPLTDQALRYFRNSLENSSGSTKFRMPTPFAVG